MLKIACLLLLCGLLIIESDAWGRRWRFRGPRVRVRRFVPRVRRFVPRVRRFVPRIRIRIPIYNKLSNIFQKQYAKLCGNKRERNCNYGLIKRVRETCSGRSCLKKHFHLYGKRGLEMKKPNENLLLKDNQAKTFLEDKRSLTYAKLAYKAASLYNECCRHSCWTSEIVKKCF